MVKTHLAPFLAVVAMAALVGLPGSRDTLDGRTRAIERGLRFIYSIARDPRVFEQYGADLLFAFLMISTTSADSAIAHMAWEMGHERALEWRRINPLVPANADADDIAALAYGDEAAARLGVPDRNLWQHLHDAAPRFSAEDFLSFDPRREPPPSDVPDACPRCRRYNARGARVCKWDGAPLTFRSRQSIYLDALVTTYGGERTGIVLGARYSDVIRWVNTFRPYPHGRHAGDPAYDDIVYAMTHVVYTLNGYSTHRISPACLPLEFEFLRSNLREAIDDKDPETLGEYLDTLRSFGVTLSDPEMQAAVDYLLRAQHPDGSWGSTDGGDPYTRYHSTWTAIDGLREYRFQPAEPCRAPSFVTPESASTPAR